MVMQKKSFHLGFRLQPTNRFTIPVLLNQIEQANLDQYFQIALLQNFDDVRNFVRKNKKGILLYSFMTTHLPLIEKELKWVNKNRSLSLTLLAGGPHTNGDPISSLKLGFDLAYSGAAETGFSQLIKKYLDEDLPDSPTIFYAPELEVLDQSVPLSRNFNISPPLEISRGCFWNCKFCQTSCQKTRHRSMESIQDYYQQLKKRGHHRRFSFICPSAFEYGAHHAKRLNYHAIEELLVYCKSNGTSYLEFGIFPSETRPDTVSELFVELIAKHCDNKKLTIGAQTGSDRLLKAMRRGHSLENIKDACEMISGKKLKPLIDIILGFPGEKNTDRHLTLNLIKRWAVQYQARIQVHYFLPLSGTSLENSIPTPLDYQTIDTLTQFEKDGLCTGWWKAGQKLSVKLLEIRDRLSNLRLEYSEVNM